MSDSKTQGIQELDKKEKDSGVHASPIEAPFLNATVLPEKLCDSSNDYQEKTQCPSGVEKSILTLDKGLRFSITVVEDAKDLKIKCKPSEEVLKLYTEITDFHLNLLSDGFKKLLAKEKEKSLGNVEFDSKVKRASPILKTNRESSINSIRNYVPEVISDMYKFLKSKACASSGTEQSLTSFHSSRSGLQKEIFHTDRQIACVVARIILHKFSYEKLRLDMCDALPEDSVKSCKDFDNYLPILRFFFKAFKILISEIEEIKKEVTEYFDIIQSSIKEDSSCTYSAECFQNYTSRFELCLEALESIIELSKITQKDIVDFYNYFQVWKSQVEKQAAKAL